MNFIGYVDGIGWIGFIIMFFWISLEWILLILLVKKLVNELVRVVLLVEGG